MWWLFLLLLLLAVPLAPLVWAMFRVSKLRFADARGRVVAPEQVPEKVMLRLKEQVEPLISSGFEYLGMRQESRGDGDYWQAFLSSAGGMVWAVAEEFEESEERRQVCLVSFGSNGSVAITRDGDGVFGFTLQGVILRSGPFVSALEQAENHAALLTEERIPIIAVDPETFLTRYEKMVSQGLDPLFERGWLLETSGHSLKVPLVKLPQVAIAWIRCELSERARKKSGSSWLLGGNLGVAATFAEPVAGADDAEGVLSEEELVREVVETPVVDEIHVEAVSDEVEDAVASVLAANERALQGAPVAAMPVGPIDGVVAEEVFEEDEGIVVEDAVAEQPAIQIPDEDGLPRDWALYQQQASKKSWGYWVGGFGARAFLFLSLLVFSIWMASSAGWGLRVVLFGVLALLVHEAGHALAMLARRSWDWSQFVIPIPHAMRAKQWAVKGGVSELLTILAGPLPGLVVGWGIFTKAYLGSPVSDTMLDVALAAVVVNGFTLLPFLPLDGGRLLDLAFLRRMPQLRILGLIVAGFVFFGLVFAGGGLVAGVLGLLMWAGVPSARRKSRLLPWLRANEKDDSEQQVVTAFSVSRECSKRKVFSGPAGIARLDELMGLSHAKKLGSLGGVMVLLLLVCSWAIPFALPVYSVTVNARDWLDAQKQAKSQAQGYLGELRPIKVTKSVNVEKEAEVVATAMADLRVWQERLGKMPSQPEKVFSDKLDLDAARVMKWRMAAHWIADEPKGRQPVAREAVRALRREAIRSADNGEGLQAFRDLSVALRIVIECEPRHSLDSWVAWLELEREVLKEVEDVSSRYELADTYIKWYEGALRQCPRPTSQKLAGLILAESQGFESLVQDLDVRTILPQPSSGGPGRKFLSALTGVGELVSVKSLQEKRELAEVFAKSSSLDEASSNLKLSRRLPLDLEQSLQRIENNYSFRQIAMSALKVKRVGMRGASQELAQLREDYGYTSRLDETNDRKALKLSRLSSAGEVVELEWLLRQ